MEVPAANIEVWMDGRRIDGYCCVSGTLFSETRLSREKNLRETFSNVSIGELIN